MLKRTTGSVVTREQNFSRQVNILSLFMQEKFHVGSFGEIQVEVPNATITRHRRSLHELLHDA